jgi:hypothetical protein
MAVALDQPVLVVGLLPSEQRQAQLLDGLETARPKQLLLVDLGLLAGCGLEAAPRERVKRACARSGRTASFTVS